MRAFVAGDDEQVPVVDIGIPLLLVYLQLLVAPAVGGA